MKKEQSEIKKIEDIDISSMVNGVKAIRAFKAVYGGAKGGSAEVSLAGQLRGEYEGQELVEEVYKGLGGLMNVSKAKINIENENKNKAKKASR